MRIVLGLGLLVLTIQSALTSVLPLTAKEIALMLRSGYSNDAVLRELSARRFADEFNSEIEKQLVSAGASSALIVALRNGTYTLTPSDMAVAKAKLAAHQARAGKELEDSSEARPANRSEPAPTSSEASQKPDVIYRHLKDDLVRWHQGSITYVNDEPLERKSLFLFFFSANWSAPGRKFTSQLAEYYNRVAPQHPEFEVIFFSADRSQFGKQHALAGCRLR
jgi:hypothetical protein